MMQEHTVNGTHTEAGHQRSRPSGPAIATKAIYEDLDCSMLRTIPMPLEGQQLSAARGGLILPIGPSKASKPLDPLAIYGAGYAGPNQFTFGTPGVGNTDSSRGMR